jgi:fructokinase
MILCCGEALIDFVPRPELRAYQPCPGGSVYNVAVGLGRLEIPVGFYCKISTDFFGDMLVDYLDDNAVDTSTCQRTRHPTTLAFVSLATKDRAEPQFSFYANESADRSLTVDELPPKLPDEVEVLHFGSISLVMEPGATALETLMAREHGHRIISLDPNVRPNLIADRAAYRQRFDHWVASVDILKLSYADMRWIYPETKFQGCLQHWFDLGVGVVILTKGGDGAEGYSAAGHFAAVGTPSVDIADTVGAGDTFLAATLAYLYRGEMMDLNHLRALTSDQLSACLTYATRAAAINCSRVGADPPYRHELEGIDE